jgi:hypothetical protein
MKKMRGDKPYMEILQGNSLCSYLYLKRGKMSSFCFFLPQNQRLKGEIGPAWGGGGGRERE